MISICFSRPTIVAQLLSSVEVDPDLKLKASIFASGRRYLSAPARVEESIPPDKRTTLRMITSEQGLLRDGCLAPSLELGDVVGPARCAGAVEAVGAGKRQRHRCRREVDRARRPGHPERSCERKGAEAIDVEGDAFVPRVDIGDLGPLVEHEDLQSILSRFAGSADLYKNVVEGFRVEADDLLAHIAQGVNQRDVTHLIESLHTLKGAALTMGLPRLSGKLAGYEATLKSTDSDEVAVEKCLASIETSNLREMLDAELTVIINDLNSLP